MRLIYGCHVVAKSIRAIMQMMASMALTRTTEAIMHVHAEIDNFEIKPALTEGYLNQSPNTCDYAQKGGDETEDNVEITAAVTINSGA